MKVIFILSSVVNTNSIKRVNEFVERGYDVKVYGFDRELNVANRSDRIDINRIATFNNSMSYGKRIAIYYKSIKTIVKETSKEDLYYLIGYDVALAFTLLSRRKYIYEEPDLTYVDGGKLFRQIGSFMDRHIIKKSVLSVFRSEGFPKFLYGDNCPDNVMAVTNRLNVQILNIPRVPKKEISEGLRIGFVGFLRYVTIYNFAEVLCRNFPQHEMHFYGTGTVQSWNEKFESLDKYPNCHLHGAFKSPDDLPEIYSNLDLVLSTYNTNSVNVRYAEPNKIYEAIYFDTPIIVSPGTFLADKVKRLGIGYDVDAMAEPQVIDFINSLTRESINEKIQNMHKIPQEEVLNINDKLFRYLHEKNYRP